MIIQGNITFLWNLKSLSTCSVKNTESLSPSRIRNFVYNSNNSKHNDILSKITLFCMKCDDVMRSERSK